MKYLYYKLNGEIETVETQERLKLEKLQEMVGGMIEFAPPEKDDTILCVNEEGLVNEMQPNPFFPMYRGPVVQGKNQDTEEGVEFDGFDDPAPYIRKIMNGAVQRELVDGGKYTIVDIGEFMAQTVRKNVLLKKIGDTWGWREPRGRKVYRLSLETKTLLIPGWEMIVIGYG
jgi:hypothetical protein